MRRFSCLHSELRVALETMPSIIMATGVLHNIAIDLKIPDINDGNEEMPDKMPEFPGNFPSNLNTGSTYRKLIVNNYFS